MPRQIWGVMLLVLGTSLCAFATTTTETEWQIGDSTALPGSYCYDASAPGGTQCANSLGAGTITTTALVGSDIDVTEITGENAGVSNGLSEDLLDGELSFVTGANTGGYTWGSGMFEVTGCVTTDGTTCIGTETTTTVLVSGTFSSVSVAGGGSGSAQLVLGGLTGLIAESDITSYFGVSPSFVTPPSNASLVAQGIPASGSFTGTTYSGGADGDLAIYSTPEGWSLYSSLGLFGAFGLAGFVSRRFGMIKGV